MRKKRLPIGIQTFADIRNPEKNYVYIDKTDLAFQLIDSGKYYFLSRPRRFGKSLFLDTLANIFQGNKELFEGLAIYDKRNWDETFPVIRISFALGDFSSGKNVIDRIADILTDNAIEMEIDPSKCKSNQLGTFFERLIKEVYQKFNSKVVILVDEYDKPIIDNIHKEDKTPSVDARNILRNFYSSLKSNDDKLEFVFLTGVSKFSKLNLFSGLNNIEDITLDKRFSVITGYTHDDVKKHFVDYLNDVDLEEVKRWYNGYNYFGEPIYNPFDILLFFSKQNEFSNYWWETGNPSFLIEILKKGNYFIPELENITVSGETLNSFDIEYIDLVALLWQTGYLTFDSKNDLFGETMYKMKVPNLEIQKSLNNLFLTYLTDIRHKSVRLKSNLAHALFDKNIEGFKTELSALFASIPHENYVKNNISSYEGYYASVLFAFLSSIGFEVKVEDSTNMGRVDMVLISHDAIFILEFKVDMPAEAALNQIKTKKYYEKYTGNSKAIYLIGIHFSSNERNISSMEWELV